ncbi:MAG: hypothetical protein NUV32_09935 [Exilispira sp.]|jgi:hypothetical protein|nr:hypothetical protein [Exilispira sp.]
MKRKFILLFLVLMLFIAYYQNCYAQSSAIYFNVGAIINGLINFGYQYYLSENLDLRGSIAIVTTSYGSAFLFIFGIQYFFDQFSGFFLGLDLGFGSISGDDYKASANLFKIFGGYRFLFNSFFIDPGLSIGSVSVGTSNVSAAGIVLEIGFLF